MQIETGLIGIDTTFLIDFFKGDDAARLFMQQHKNRLIVSELVIYEYLCGTITPDHRDKFLTAITAFSQAPLDHATVQLSAMLFRLAKIAGHSLGNQDALIAGSYLSKGTRTIVTRNTRHFANIEGLKVLGY